MILRAAEARAAMLLRSHGVQLLNEAWLCAQESRQEPWQFAVELHVLREAGLTNTDVRWLLANGLSAHGEELTRRTDICRRFAPITSLALGERHCLILTLTGHELVMRHLQDIDRRSPSIYTGDVGPGLTKSRLKDPVPNRGSTSEEPRGETPYWDAALHDLWFRGRIIKRFTRPAPAQETILSTLQEDGWPPGVDDPLPAGKGSQDPKRRLHYTIQNLNRGQTPPSLHFFINGNGQLIRWKVIAEPQQAADHRHDSNGPGAR